MLNTMDKSNYYKYTIFDIVSFSKETKKHIGLEDILHIASLDLVIL